MSDWRPGGDPFRWPHGFVEYSRLPDLCGVEIDPSGTKCLRSRRAPVHEATPIIVNNVVIARDLDETDAK